MTDIVKQPVPRTRGDEPKVSTSYGEVDACSPHARG